MTITIEQTIYEPIPTGKYPAKIANIEEAEGQFGPQLKFEFELPPGDDGEDRTLLGWASRKFSNKSKLYKWTQAALGGGPIDRSYTFNSRDLIGRPVYIHVVEEQGDNGPYNKITSLAPYDKQESLPEAPPPPDIPPPPDLPF
jgi:hypothetical protein